MQIQPDTSQTGLFKAGKVIGFGVALSVFVYVFYMLLTILQKMPSFIEYWHVIATALALYAIGIIALGRRKWGI